MRCSVVKTQIKRFGSSTSDELRGSEREQVRHISDAFHRREILPKIESIGVAGMVSKVVCCAAEYSKEFVVTVSVRTKFRLPAEMPLADKSSFIAVCFQQRCDSRMLWRKALIKGVGLQRFVQPDLDSLGIATCNKGASCWSTDRSGGVCA